MANQTLTIGMNGISVAQLIKTDANKLELTYHPAWLASPGARPLSYSLPLTHQTLKGPKVYDFFDNLLPDNPIIRQRIQREFNTPTVHPFDLLAEIGKDCVGALQFSQTHDLTFDRSIRCKSLTDKNIAKTLQAFQTAPLGMRSEEEFRISIAGAQEKSAFFWHKNKWNIPFDSTPTSHIFKLPIGNLVHQNMDLTDSCENEWLCSEIARAYQLPTAKCEINTFEGTKALIVERFDRKTAKDKSWIMRLPQEDICQALGTSPNRKYQSDGGPGIVEIMKLLNGAIDPAKDRGIFFRAQILFWMLAAIDGHGKNFSLFIQPEGKYQLTPLYDIMSAHPLITNKQLQAKKIKMAMALEGKNKHYHWHNAQYRHFIQTAKAANYSEQQAEKDLDDMLTQLEPVIETVSKKLPKGFPKKIAQPTFDGMRQFKQRLKGN